MTAGMEVSAAVSAAPGNGNRVPVEQAEAELAEADGLRVVLQRTAREQLTAERSPLTRATVLRRAHDLLLARQSNHEVSA